MLTRQTTRRIDLPALVVGMGLALGVGFSQPHGLWLVTAVVVAMLSVAGYALAPEAAILSLVVVRPVVDVYVYRFSLAGVNLGMLWAGLMAAFCVLYLLTHVSSLSRVSHRLAAPSLFLALLVALTFTRPGTMAAATDALKVGTWLILTVTIAAIASRSEGRARVLRFMGYAAIVTATTILVLVFQNRFGAAFYAHALTYEQDAGPHGLAFAAVTVLPFVLLGVLKERKTIIPLIVAGVLSLEVVLSYVRSAYFGFAVIMLAFSVIALKGSRLRTRIIGVGVWVLVAAVGYYVQDELVKRWLDLLGKNAESMPGSSGSGRNLIWSAVWHQSLATPLRTMLGAGSEASIRYSIHAGLGDLWSHNDLLEVLASGGVVLVCGYLVLLLWMGQAAVGVARMKIADWPSRSFGILALATVVGFFLMSFTNGILFSLPETTFMGVLVGVCYGFTAQSGTELAPTRGSAGGTSLVPSAPVTAARTFMSLE